MQDVGPAHQLQNLFLIHAGVDTVKANCLHDQLLTHPDAVDAGLRIWFDKKHGGPPRSC